MVCALQNRILLRKIVEDVHVSTKMTVPCLLCLISGTWQYSPVSDKPTFHGKEKEVSRIEMKLFFGM